VLGEAGTTQAFTYQIEHLQKQLFDSLCGSLPIGFGICDTALRIVWVNHAWALMDGVPVEDHIGKTVCELLRLDSCPMEAEMIEVLRTGKAKWGIELIAKGPIRPTISTWIVGLVPFRFGNENYVGSITIERSPKRVFEAFTVARSAVGDFLTGDESLPERPRLTKRQIDVIRLIAKGKTSKQVASLLGISFRTADNVRTQIMTKLDLHTAADLTRYAIRNGLVTPNE
jgi:DNA-binding CsgD family transcriptional regulator